MQVFTQSGEDLKYTSNKRGAVLVAQQLENWLADVGSNPVGCKTILILYFFLSRVIKQLIGTTSTRPLTTCPRQLAT